MNRFNLDIYSHIYLQQHTSSSKWIDVNNKFKHNRTCLKHNNKTWWFLWENKDGMFELLFSTFDVH